MPTVDVVHQQPIHVINTNGVKGEIAPGSRGMSPVNPAHIHKTTYYGIEVLEKLIWKDWTKGKEYSKNLVLKNISVKTLKLSYRVPESRFFSTLYPKPLFLSAGSSFTLPITFRPLETVGYDDQVVFFFKNGDEFIIPLRAVLPKTDISIPINLDFKMCAVKDSSSISFDVYNTGDLDTTLQWECQEPFTIQPPEADLKYQSCVKFTATFRPQAAKVYEVKAICKFGSDFRMKRPTAFYGIGKFPHLLISSSGGKPITENNKRLKSIETEVNFGCIPVASTVNHFVDLHNLSSVRTPFHVERIVGMSRMDTAYHCNQTHGVVPPMSFMRIPITFTPNTVDACSIDYFSVASVGDISRSVIKCVGSSTGPEVTLGLNHINFMQLDEGRTATRTLDIINISNVEAIYQFELDCEESAFKFQTTSGILKPNSTQTIIISFVPQFPINYFRRIACLVHNQPPLYLDLMGTCHSETEKPAVLKYDHVVRYHTHVERGLSFIAPEQLNEMLKAKRLGVDHNGCLEVLHDEDKVGLTLNTSIKDIPRYERYFHDGFHSELSYVLPHVTTDVDVLEFGNIQDLNMPVDKTINVTNHTRGKVTVQWMGDSSHPFSVTPATLDIPPLKACSFRVKFNGNLPNKLFGSELECFVFYKSMRDYRLVEDKTHCPPWCLTVKCLANTFQPNNETYLPRTALIPPVVVFPAINTGEAAYRTLVMANTGDTPIMYNLAESIKAQSLVRSRCGTKESKNEVFSVKPRQGLLRSGYQVFTICMRPTVVNSFSHELIVRLNDNDKYDQMIHLCGSAESAEVLLDNEGAMFFKPTCVASESNRTYGFKNVSRIPLRFQWNLSFEDKKILKVQPENGVIQPNQSLVQTWSFSPTEDKKFVMKPSLVVWGQGLSATSSGGKKRKFTVRAVGEGSLGDLQTDPDHKCLDFGDIIVGSSSSRRITIYNNSNCSLQFKLIIDFFDGLQTGTGGAQGSPKLEFDVVEGVLPARSKKFITATIRPMERIFYQYAISYQLVTSNGALTHPAVREPQHLMHIFATGVFPVLKVTDIRSLGSAVGISKKTLWNLFSVDNLNAYLDSDPSSDELTYNIATRHSTRPRDSVMTRAVLDFNFSAAPLGSEACTVSINFENIGTVPCEWAFMFPRDIQMELGYWTESGDCDQDELHDMKVMDNKLFSVSPKKGLLKPGDTITITFSYQHTMAGTDRLPVLLKLAKGREIMLNFVGVTVEPTVPYIHFPSNKHTFNPVPVGEKISPKQVYELYNGGALPVTYVCDLTPLDIIKEENFDQPIFECLNPSGEILPGRAISIEWRFFPLEAKTYMIDIPIQVHNGETAIVTFVGIGYDKRIMGDTMPLSDQPDLCGVPNIQTAQIPGQLGYLSMERISFGNMPLFSQARRMVFVTNKSKDRSIFFEWHVTSHTDTQFLNIYPLRGEIRPNEYKMCRVTFQASGVPSFYDLDLVCEIADLHEYTKFKSQLVDWEKERDRQMTEFCVTEDDLDADLRTPKVVDIMDAEPTGRLSKLDALAEGRPVSADGELSKYKTLPPIRQLTADEERNLKWKKQKKLSHLWKKPEPPKPFLLHLGITARTHDTRHFQANFPEEYCHFFIDRTLSDRASNIKSDVPGNPLLDCSVAESNIVASVLGNCLRGLLDDTYFIQAVKKVMLEPVPYFKQFTESKPISPWSSTPRDDQAEGSMDSLLLQENRSPRLSGGSFRDTASDIIENPSIITPQDSERSCSIGNDSFRMSPFRQLMIDEETRLTEEAEVLKTKQIIKKLPEFGNTVEQVLENAVLNLMYEALSSEYSVVSKPRFIAMPRRPQSTKSRFSQN